MGVLLAFLVGWSVGAKAGPSGFEDVVEAAKAVRASQEFSALLAVVRTHTADSLAALGKVVSGETPMPEAGDLLAQVQRLAARRPG
jgi:hypothetical protein